MTPSSLDDLLVTEQLPEEFRQTIDDVCKPLAEHIAALPRSSDQCLTIGLCGAQGSGKSTVTKVIGLLLETLGFTVQALSLDDFYLTHAARLALGKHVHPLLQTRGVPGTHELTLLVEVLDSLRSGRATTLPLFDKAADDRRTREQWSTSSASVQIILLEGWCVGASPQSPAELLSPVNTLERNHDAQGIWRTFVNDALGSDYRRVFATIDWQILLAAPDFAVVCEWRAQQEEKLRQRLLHEGGDVSRLMNEQGIRGFVAHYERLTRHMLREMPGRVDACVRLDRKRRAIEVQYR